MLHCLLEKKCLILTHAFYFAGADGSETTYSASWVQQRLHRHFSGEGAAEFLERRKGAAQRHKKNWARLWTSNRWVNIKNT